MQERLELVSQDQVWAAVAAIEERYALGQIDRAAADRRINDCRRAVTPRDLYKASGGLAGDRHRQDWRERGRTAMGLLLLLVLMALGTLLVTWAMGLANGNVPGITE